MAADDKPVWLIAQGVNSEVLLRGLFVPHTRVAATAYSDEGMMSGECDPAIRNPQVSGRRCSHARILLILRTSCLSGFLMKPTVSGLARFNSESGS